MTQNEKTNTAKTDDLFNALTHEQIREVLNATFKLLQPEQIKRLLESLNPDISLTLKRLLTPQAVTASKTRVVSDDKLFAEWRDLWRQWSNVASEVGEEDGAYVQQEADWEEPYFDPCALAEDLEKIAAKMTPMLAEVFALEQEDDDCFADELQAINDSIDSYPEWMCADAEPCAFERITTECLLKWEWLVTQNSQESVLTFLERLLKLENELSHCSLDWQAYHVFFTTTLPADQQQQIFEHIRANQDSSDWKQKLTSAHGRWNEIYRDYAQKFDQDAHLDLCRLNLAQNWQCGPPLIADLTKKGNLPEVNKLYMQTIASYAKSSGYSRVEDWQPEQKMLTSGAIYGSGEPNSTITDLLADWISVAEKLNLGERTLSLRYQKMLYATPFAWDNIADFYRQHRERPPIMTLTEQWRNIMYDRSLPGGFGERKKETKDTWVNWLLQAGLNDDKSAFMLKMEGWLAQLRVDGVAFSDQQKTVRLLTCDLAALSGDNVPFPRLLALMGRPDRTDELIAARQQWLRRLDGGRFSAALCECWRKHVVLLAPDPNAHHKSDYTPHAGWLMVIQEIDPVGCQNLIARWRIDHQRRTNLWKALRAAGFTG